MSHPILILGGYGNFGKRIARKLTRHGLGVIIAGRNAQKAEALCTELGAHLSKAAVFDVTQQLDEAINHLKPKVVINTCGPFQNADYRVAQSCIEAGVHYVDLADGRDFVTGISKLNEQAKARGVLVVSGASTVPGLSSAVLSHYAQEFGRIDKLTFGISPGQKAERGLATTQGIMSYVGRPLRPGFGQKQIRYGWQDIYRQDYPGLGKRWMANCDIPDLDLLPQAFGIKDIQFSAGLELAPLHLGLYALSCLVRIGMPLPLEKWTEFLLKASNAFNHFGSADGGMHMIIEGLDPSSQPLKRLWYIIAKNGHGPYIPTIPAVILAKQLAKDEIRERGAKACVNLVSLEDYLGELANFDIEVTSFLCHPTK